MGIRKVRLIPNKNIDAQKWKKRIERAVNQYRVTLEGRKTIKQL